MTLHIFEPQVGSGDGTKHIGIVQYALVLCEPSSDLKYPLRSNLFLGHRLGIHPKDKSSINRSLVNARYFNVT